MIVDEFLSYYVSELAFLREMGTEFAEKYPKVAGRLLLGADSCEDPHVERLLEGIAFLTARIRRKIDDEFPEITDAFFQVLYPHYQRPVPSMTIVQLAPGDDKAALEKGVTVEAGSRMLSGAINGVQCGYRTVYPVTLWPVRVAWSRVQNDCVGVGCAPREAVSMIRIGLQCEGIRFNKLPLEDPEFVLRFYLDGAPASVHGLYESLFNHVCGVSVRAMGESDPVLAGLSLRQVGFGQDEGMYPYPGYAPPAYRLLQEYFAFPEKFLFADVTGWRHPRDPGLDQSVELLIFLDREPPSSVKINDLTFRLGCTPVVNLDSRVAEPIRFDQTRVEYPIILDVDNPWAYEVYSVDTVTGNDGYLGREVEYEPFYSLRHSAGAGASDRQAYWHASRRQPEGGTDGGTDVHLTFVSDGFRPSRPASEVISVRVTCTNRDAPSRLGFGGPQGVFLLQSTAAVSRFAHCLRKPTPTLRPKTGRGAQWRLISHLSLNHLSLTESGRGAESLREILRLYDFADDPVTRQQIAGVSAVSSRTVPGRVGAFACMGTEVTVEFDEDRFVGSGIFLLASVLERFFGTYAAINSFSRLVAKTSREGPLKRWPPRAGDRVLL